MSKVEEFIYRIQVEAHKGFHQGLRIWVDDHSSAIRALREFDKHYGGSNEGD